MGLAICQVRSYRLRSGGIIIEILLQNIWEKEQLEDKEHNKEFNQDNQPKRLAQPHFLKTFHIKTEYLLDCGIYIHGICVLQPYLM